MLMFFMILLAAVPVLLVICALFAGSVLRESREEEESSHAGQGVAAEPVFTPSPPRFFAETNTRSTASRIPIEVLLSRIEHHVRLEQAAAESFVEAPTSESLHSRTASPFMN